MDAFCVHYISRFGPIQRQACTKKSLTGYARLFYSTERAASRGKNLAPEKERNVGGLMDKRRLGSIGIVVFFFAILLYLFLTLPSIYFEETLPAMGEAKIAPFWLAVASWLLGVFVGCVVTTLLWESDWIRWARQNPPS
jgi:hypothetical protein